MASLLFDRFNVLRTLGKGAHAVVYVVRDIVDHQLVALKVVESGTKELVDRLAVQAEAQRLDHPNIVRVLEPLLVGRHPVFGAGKPMVGIVLEFIEGDSLDRHLRSLGGKLTSREAVEIGLDVTRAVAHAHSFEPPIIHRDLKPGNVIIDADGRALLTDFGHAMLLGGADQVRLTRSFVALGTRQYAAPELMLNAKYATPSADLYGIGAILYHLLTGAYPHDDLRHRDESPHRVGALVPDVPQALDDLISHLLADTPEERPSSAAEVERALRAILGALE